MGPIAGSKRRPLTRDDLDAATANLPGDCDHPRGLGLHASCHTAATLEVWYHDGLLLLHCGRCQAPVAAIRVASAPPSVVLQ